ncbi:MAG TPA: FAD-dependent oxidoreductase [Blastocatellia bacterium]|nr:FAD-dependent oxidoreductase [Blastocatellia bacterium]
MITQLNNNEFDAIIVGSGPAGATIARELSKRQKRVLILERGGNAPLRESFLATVSIVNAVSVGDDLVTMRAFTTGGTTAVYFAVADSPPLEVFRSLGIDIARELDEAQQELPLAVLPDELLGVQAIRVRDSALELGYPWKKKTMLIDLSKCASGYTYEAKWTARSYLHEAVEEGATLINRARVLKVLVERNRAIGVEYTRHKWRKHRDVCRAFGTRIILAAGAAASPIILRDSGMKNAANRGFYCHPGFAVFGTISGLKAGENFVASMGAELEDDIALGDANFARTFYRMFMLGNRRFVRALRHSKSIGVGVMVKDGLGGELKEDGCYYKELTHEDLKKLEKGEQMARRIIQNAGGKRMFKSRSTAANMGGSIRIKEHVDESLQTEYSNLHVCDGSVIPDNVKLSPTLTLICLGKYLARHLSQTL